MLFTSTHIHIYIERGGVIHSPHPLSPTTTPPFPTVQRVHFLHPKATLKEESLVKAATRSGVIWDMSWWPTSFIVIWQKKIIFSSKLIHAHWRLYEQGLSWLQSNSYVKNSGKAENLLWASVNGFVWCQWPESLVSFKRKGQIVPFRKTRGKLNMGKSHSLYSFLKKKYLEPWRQFEHELLTSCLVDNYVFLWIFCDMVGISSTSMHPKLPLCLIMPKQPYQEESKSFNIIVMMSLGYEKMVEKCQWRFSETEFSCHYNIS